jgi:hypothetical protein
MRPSLTRPDIKRGPAWSPSPKGNRPHLDPFALTPGATVLRVYRDGFGLVLNTLVVFLGAHEGQALVVPLEIALHGSAPEQSLTLIDPCALDEEAHLMDPVSLDAIDFEEGYEQGVWSAMNERSASERTANRRPSWFGRGFVAGHRDRLAGTKAPMGSPHPLNRELRRLAAIYPEEHRTKEERLCEW